MIIPPVLQQTGRTEVIFRGRRLTYFGGCDYFRLASDPKVCQAVLAGLRAYGLNVAASRQTTGDHRLYHRLEESVTRFFGVERAVLAPTGYMANLAAAASMEGCRFLVDQRAHPSLVAAVRAAGGRVHFLRHQHPADWRRALQRTPPRERPVIVTDGVFGQNGAMAVLSAFLEMLPRRGVLFVDDAHGAGVLGPRARGTPEFYGISDARVVQTITLSKAFGVYGGAVLGGGERMVEIARSRLLAGSTPLPLPLAAGALAALDRVRRDDRLREALRRNIRYVKKSLAEQGWSRCLEPTPILAFDPQSAAQERKLQQGLLRRRIFPSRICYPGGREGGYFRFAISALHRREELDRLLDSLADVGPGLA